MKTYNFNRIIILFFLASIIPSILLSQGIKEYTSKNSKEKIGKSILITQSPVTAAGFSDGHGRTPVLTSKQEIPDTIGLITFYVNDEGTVKKGSYSVSLYFLTPQGGNAIADQFEKQTVQVLKDRFRDEGKVLLTPNEFLNTKNKRDYYFKTFAPDVSKMAKFLSNIETKEAVIAAEADGYRTFDITAAWDAIRAESLVDDLGKKIGLKGLLSVAIILQSDKKEINMMSMRMALNGPNPIPKEDKKYVAQNMGNGYYFGQIYSDCNFSFPKPVLIGTYEDIKKASKERTSDVMIETSSAIINMDINGIEVITEAMVDKSFQSMYEAIEKAASKYKK